MRTTTVTEPRCLIRGHDHPLTVIIRHTQDGTGSVGFTWECPTGRYRWFALDGRTPVDVTRTVRPRHGWPRVAESANRTAI